MDLSILLPLDFKCQHFNADNELVLYKCVQAHESQDNWQPKDVPALFIRVAEEGQILDWVQPLGTHDAYQTGDKVNHNGQVWISIVDNNMGPSVSELGNFYFNEKKIIK